MSGKYALFYTISSCHNIFYSSDTPIQSQRSQDESSERRIPISSSAILENRKADSDEIVS